MITLSYACHCGWKSSVLDDAQEHANQTSHHVDVRGFLTPNKITVDKTAIEERAREKAREAMILRLAKERGLVQQEQRGKKR